MTALAGRRGLWIGALGPARPAVGLHHCFDLERLRRLAGARRDHARERG